MEKYRENNLKLENSIETYESKNRSMKKFMKELNELRNSLKEKEQMLLEKEKDLQKTVTFSLEISKVIRPYCQKMSKMRRKMTEFYQNLANLSSSEVIKCLLLQ